MSETKKSAVSKIVASCIGVLLLIFIAGCSFNAFPEQLPAPVISFEDTGNVITWSPVEHASKYTVYESNTKLVDISTNGTEDLRYDFTSVLKSSGKYFFRVNARGEGDYIDSVPSNVLTFSYEEVIGQEEKEYTGQVTPTEKIDNSLDVDKMPAELEVVGNLLLWEVPDDLEVEKYYVNFYISGNKNVTIESDENHYDISEIGTDKIISFRVGSVIDDTIYYSETLLHNPSDHGYYSTVFAIGNILADHHIENMGELTDVLRYAFVNRLSELHIEFSTTFMSTVKSSYGTQAQLGHIMSAISTANAGFLDTKHYSYTVTDDADDERQLLVAFDYSDSDVEGAESNVEPWVSGDRTDLLQSTKNTPYYLTTEVLAMESRAEDYDDFASDYRDRIVEVTTSEQLFWAVQYGFTPVFTSEDCTAFTIYERAKEVLREIISDEMTDYEKSLSIFDWICMNTVYDYDTYGDKLDSHKNMAHKTYYLEGVFEDGLAVCDGFSKAYSLLCNMEGIPCIRVVGYRYEIPYGHAWNKIYVDGKWYLVDLTGSEHETEALQTTEGEDGLLATIYPQYYTHFYTKMYVNAFTDGGIAKSYFYKVTSWEMEGSNPKKYTNNSILPDKSNVEEAMHYVYFSNILGGTWFQKVVSFEMDGASPKLYLLSSSTGGDYIKLSNGIVRTETLSRRYFMVPAYETDTGREHLEFVSTTSESFKVDVTASDHNVYHENVTFDVDSLTDIRKLNDVITYIKTIDDSWDIDSRAGYAINLDAVKSKLQSELEIGGDISNLTIDELIGLLNSDYDANIDLERYEHLRSSNTFLVKNYDDFEMCMLFLFYSGYEGVEILIDGNYFRHLQTVAAEGVHWLQGEFTAVKENNDEFNSEFNGIYSYGLLFRVNAYGSYELFEYSEDTDGLIVLFSLQDK